MSRSESDLLGEGDLTVARCSECGRWSTPRVTGTAPSGWWKIVSPPLGAVTYLCDGCDKRSPGRVEWAVMEESRLPLSMHVVVSRWSSQEEAEAYRAAREVERKQHERRLRERFGDEKVMSFGPGPSYVACRRVSEWERVG